MIRNAFDDSILGESVVDEVRAIREAIDEEVDHDIKKLAERSQKKSEEIRKAHGMRVAQIPSNTRSATERSTSDTATN